MVMLGEADEFGLEPPPNMPGAFQKPNGALGVPPLWLQNGPASTPEISAAGRTRALHAEAGRGRAGRIKGSLTNVGR
jgi:hypothetical protein